MATQADVRRIARALPGTVEETGRFAFALPVKDKLKRGVWVWLERLTPKKARCRTRRSSRSASRTSARRTSLLKSDPVRFFTEPHYNGYPAVLLHLPDHARAGAARPLARRLAVCGRA
ncbi:MAG: hypothetical protein IPJ78_19410 [Gemmatimonadetes bacterium]|nr:hypothetical protein [Gemmatimonadota bacterium]